MNDIIQSQGLMANQAGQYQMLQPSEYQQGAPASLSQIDSTPPDMSGMVELADAVAEKKRQQKLETGLEKSKGYAPSMQKNSGADAGKITPQASSVMSGNGMNDMLGGMGLGKTMPNSPMKPSMGVAAQAGVSGGAGGAAAGGAAAGGGAWSKLSGMISRM